MKIKTIKKPNKICCFSWLSFRIYHDLLFFYYDGDIGRGKTLDLFNRNN